MNLKGRPLQLVRDAVFLHLETLDKAAETAKRDSIRERFLRDIALLETVLLELEDPPAAPAPPGPVLQHLRAHIRALAANNTATLEELENSYRLARGTLSRVLHGREPDYEKLRELAYTLSLPPKG